MNKPQILKNCLRKSSKPVEVVIPKIVEEKEKKLAPIVLKVLQKLGKPKNIYNTIRDLIELKSGDNKTERCNYLLTWDQFLEECGPGCDLEKVKELVHEMYEAMKNPDKYPAENSVIIICFLIVIFIYCYFKL